MNKSTTKILLGIFGTVAVIAVAALAWTTLHPTISTQDINAAIDAKLGLQSTLLGNQVVPTTVGCQSDKLAKVYGLALNALNTSPGSAGNEPIAVKFNVYAEGATRRATTLTTVSTIPATDTAWAADQCPGVYIFDPVATTTGVNSKIYGVMGDPGITLTDDGNIRVDTRVTSVVHFTAYMGQHATLYAKMTDTTGIEVGLYPQANCANDTSTYCQLNATAVGFYTSTSNSSQNAIGANGELHIKIKYKDTAYADREYCDEGCVIALDGGSSTTGGRYVYDKSPFVYVGNTQLELAEVSQDDTGRTGYTSYERKLEADADWFYMFSVPVVYNVNQPLIVTGGVRNSEYPVRIEAQANSNDPTDDWTIDLLARGKFELQNGLMSVGAADQSGTAVHTISRVTYMAS